MDFDSNIDSGLSGKMPTLSIIVPCYNESDVIPAFYNRITAVLGTFITDYEIIFINDGSEDQSIEIISILRQGDSRVKLVDLSRNFGKEIAMTAGVDFACGEALIVIDAVLQDPPELIQEMLRYWKEGYDVVYATRIQRDGETWFKRLTARAFYWVISRLSKTKIPENTGDYRLMSRRAVEAVKQFQEQHRFMKGLFCWIGYRQLSIPYHRESRHAGKTKWNYWQLWNFAIEGITSFSYGPLKVASYLGVLTAFGSIGYALVLILKVVFWGRDVPGYASIMVTLLFIGAVQLITLGIIGEYLGRIFNEVKRRPLYLVQKLSGVIPAPSLNISNRTATSLTQLNNVNNCSPP